MAANESHPEYMMRNEEAVVLLRNEDSEQMNDEQTYITTIAKRQTLTRKSYSHTNEAYE